MELSEHDSDSDMNPDVIVTAEVGTEDDPDGEIKIKIDFYTMYASKALSPLFVRRETNVSYVVRNGCYTA